MWAKPTMPVSTSITPGANQNELEAMSPVTGSNWAPVRRVPAGKMVDGFVPTSMCPVVGSPGGGGPTVKVADPVDGVSTLW